MVMKNSILSLIFILILCVVASAQKIGIKAGGNFTNVIGGDNSASSGSSDKHLYVSGFHAGGFGEFDVAEIVSLQVEAVYSTKGFKQKYSTSSLLVNTTEEVKYTYSYIDIPLIINIHFGQMGSYIGIGPQVSFLAGAQWNGTQTNTYTNTAPPPLTNTSSSFTVSGKDKTGYSKTDFGAIIGTGSKWDSGIEYCIRAGYGITNIIDPSASLSNAVWHNLVFSVSIGYGFGTGGGGGGDRYGHKYNKKRR
ncbi:MAG: PorT family protein [Bacteroidetes bacterium]|nr:MAG: PorT family protein [Bacteroidota bacterium]